MVNVLIADDDESIRDVITLALREEGYTVSAVNDGETLLSSLRASPERLVVLVDRLMPKMNGLEVLKVVAGDSVLRQRHAYALSSAASAELTQEQRSLMADLDVLILPKPFDLDQLVSIVAELARRIQATRET